MFITLTYVCNILTYIMHSHRSDHAPGKLNAAKLVFLLVETINAIHPTIAKGKLQLCKSIKQTNKQTNKNDPVHSNGTSIYLQADRPGGRA